MAKGGEMITNALCLDCDITFSLTYYGELCPICKDDNFVFITEHCLLLKNSVRRNKDA